MFRVVSPPINRNTNNRIYSIWYYSIVIYKNNCFTRNEENVIHKHAGPEAKGSNPTAELTLLWARNPFKGNFNPWQVSGKESGEIFFKRQHGCGKGITLNTYPSSGAQIAVSTASGTGQL